MIPHRLVFILLALVALIALVVIPRVGRRGPDAAMLGEASVSGSPDPSDSRLSGAGEVGPLESRRSVAEGIAERLCRISIEVAGGDELVREPLTVRLVPASEVVEREGGCPPRVGRLEEAGWRPELGGARSFDCRGGLLSIVLPEHELFVAEIRGAEQVFAILRGRRITAGAREHAIVVAGQGFGELEVVHGFTGEPLSELEIRAWASGPEQEPRELVVTGSFVVGGRSDEGALPRPGPPGWAVQLGNRPLASPVTVPLAEHDRTLWIGREGFAGQELSCPAGERRARVALSPACALDVRLMGVRRGEKVHLVVTQAGSGPAGWTSIRHDGLYTLHDLVPGPARLRVRSSLASGALVPLHDMELVLEAGATERIELDLRTGEAQAEPARVVVDLRLGPALRGLLTDRTRLLLLQRREEDAWPVADLGLGVLRPTLDGRSYASGSLPPGEYAAGLVGVGVVEAFQLEAGEQRTVTLSVDESLAWVDLVLEGDGAERLADVLREPEGRITRSTTPPWLARSWADDRVSLGLDRRADGRLAFACPSGSVRLLPVDRRGRALGAMTLHALTPGPNTIVLQLDSTRVKEVVLATSGLPPTQAPELRRAIRASLAGERVLVVGAAGMGAASGSEHVLHFERAGRFDLELPVVLGGHRLTTPQPIRLDVHAGAPLELALDWR